MRLVLHVTDANLSRLMREGGHGRIPLAMLTVGDVSGRGWGFLPPWAQLALFPDKGTHAGIRHAERQHEPFILRRVCPTVRRERHRNHELPIAGRYWWGVAWRRSWPAVRWVLLDPDIVTDNPNA